MSQGEVAGIIRRCIHINYRIVPELVQPLLPPNLTLRLHGGFAMAGICVLQLEKVRAKGRMEFLGSSHNASAHRIAVSFKDAQGQPQQGLHVFLRHCNSSPGMVGGGWIFKEQPKPAEFKYDGVGGTVFSEMKSKDGSTHFRIAGTPSAEISRQSGFADIGEAASFFMPGKTDGTFRPPWKYESIEIKALATSVFSGTPQFPEHSTFLDSALMALDTEHVWSSEGDLYC